MASTMYCNTPDCDQVAVVLQTMLEDGATAALCFGHYVGVCRAIVDSIDQAERDEAAAQAAAALEHVTAPAATDDGPTVVRRGTSRSRRAYEARQRAKEDAGAAEDPDEAIAAPGPNLAGVGHPDDGQ